MNPQTNPPVDNALQVMGRITDDAVMDLVCLGEFVEAGDVAAQANLEELSDMIAASLSQTRERNCGVLAKRKDEL